MAHLDWPRIAADLDDLGYAVSRTPLLRADECRELAALFDDDGRFRNRVDMERHRFGVGEYRYFAEPLPRLVSSLRSALFPPLAAIANRWNESLGAEERFPADHGAYRARCHAQGQRDPTPLLLRYRAGGYNRLHQDLYGKLAFPLQATVLLSRPGRDFEGGEFLLLENRPRMQSRGDAVALERGQMIVFPNQARPVEGPRGISRASVRHGVSRLHRGERHTLGIIFHDAKI